MQEAFKNLKEALEERSANASDQPQWQITQHPEIPDVLLVDGQGPNSVDFAAADGREVRFVRC